MPAMRGSAWISTSDLVRALPNREPETKAKQNATAMMTAGGNPLPTKQIQQGPSFCPTCGQSHRLGTVCSKSLTSALETFLKGVTMSGNKRGNPAHDSSTGEFTSASHVSTSQTKGEVGGPSERTVARKERAAVKETAKKTGGKVPTPSTPLPKSPAEQAKEPAAAAPAAKESPTVPFASKPGEAGPAAAMSSAADSPKQEPMESFMGEVAEPSAPAKKEKKAKAALLSQEDPIVPRTQREKNVLDRVGPDAVRFTRRKQEKAAQKREKVQKEAAAFAANPVTPPGAATPTAPSAPQKPAAGGEQKTIAEPGAIPAPVSPKQDAMDSFMADVAKPSGNTPTEAVATPAGVPKSSATTPTIPSAKESGSVATAPTMKQAAPSSTVMGKPGAAATEPVGAVPQPMSTGHDQQGPMAVMAPDAPAGNGTMAGHAGAKKKPAGEQPKVGMSPEQLNQRMADFESNVAKQRDRQAARAAGLPESPEPAPDVSGPFGHNVGNVAYHQKNQEALGGGASPEEAHAQGIQAGQQAFNERQRGLQAQSGEPVAQQPKWDQHLQPSSSPPMTPANQMGPGTQMGAAPAGMTGPSGTQVGPSPAGMVGPGGTQVGPGPTGPGGTQVSPAPKMPRAPKTQPGGSTPPSPSGPTFTPPASTTTPGQTPEPTAGGKMQAGGKGPGSLLKQPWLSYGTGASIGGGLFTPGGTIAPTAGAAAQGVHSLLGTPGAPSAAQQSATGQGTAKEQLQNNVARRDAHLARLKNYAQGTGSHP